MMIRVLRATAKMHTKCLLNFTHTDGIFRASEVVATVEPSLGSATREDELGAGDSDKF